MSTGPIGVLVVDDSPTGRRLVRAVVESDPAFRILGEAASGEEAVALAARLRPDLVTMDIVMPTLDGYMATERIMASTPVPVVLVSANTDVREVEVAMKALEAGALSVVERPPGPAAPDFDVARKAFLATLAAMAEVRVVTRRLAPSAPPAPDTGPPRGRPRPLTKRGIVAIGCSTGGPAVLHAVLARLPADLPAPILVVQHMTPAFVTGMADWLDRSSPLAVRVATDGERLEPAVVYMAPDGHHLGVGGRARVVLSDAPPIGGFRPSATHLFRSAAAAFGPSCLALVLSGMGQDGVAGLLAVANAGGRVIAQDEETSVVFGMPGAAVAAGVVDEILSAPELAGRIKELV